MNLAELFAWNLAASIMVMIIAIVTWLCQRIV